MVSKEGGLVLWACNQYTETPQYYSTKREKPNGCLMLALIDMKRVLRDLETSFGLWGVMLVLLCAAGAAATCRGGSEKLDQRVRDK